MTNIEFTERLSQLNEDIADLRNQQQKKSEEVLLLRKEWCNELCKQYSKYIGKRVKIFFKRVVSDSLTKEIEREGFLVGFSCKGYQKNISPDVAKVKKDGSPSKILLSEWDIYNYDEIVSINIVE